MNQSLNATLIRWLWLNIVCRNLNLHRKTMVRIRPANLYVALFIIKIKDWLIKIHTKLSSRWVSVLEFHNPTLGIGKVFGQESAAVKWNYQIFGLHQVTVCQKLGVILVLNWFKNWSQPKMLFTKKVRLNWYSSMNFFLERFGWFLT